jgi:hypothetical protein
MYMRCSRPLCLPLTIGFFVSAISLFSQSPPLVSQPDTVTAADSVVTFNEIMYRPAGDDDGLEWVELHNQMSVDMDISNWRIEGGVDFQFPTNTVLSASRYIIVAADPNRLRNAAPATNIYGPFSNRLSNSGETLRLRNNSGRLMDEVTYGDEDPWPVGADGSGASLAKLGRFNASSPAANWRPSTQPGGTPASENFPIQQNTTPRVMQLFSGNASSRWLVPSENSTSQAWTLSAFDDAQWTTGTASLGYDSTTTGVPGVPGPARAYTFNGTFNDVAGSGFNGQNYGAQFSPLIAPQINGGQSIAFDGITNEVRLMDPVNPAAYTISLWVSVDEVRSCSLIVRTDSRGTFTSYSHQLRINGAGKFEHYIFDTAGRSVIATNDILPGVWYHVAISATSGGTMQIYVNGVSSGIPRTIGSLWAGGDQWRLGPDGGNAPNFFKGRLDEVGIWHTALDNATVEKLASGISPAQLGGFRTLFATDVQNSLYGKNSSLLLRIPFDLSGPMFFEDLTLQMRYADGFVAYLNGMEVARRNAPQTISWDSRATADRTSTDAASPESFNLSAHTGMLTPGKNVLAIHALNLTSNDPNFLITAELSGLPASAESVKGVLFSEVAGAGSVPFFVEFLNTADQSANLSSCTLLSSRGGRSQLRSRTLAAGARLILHTNEFQFQVQDGDRLFLLGPDGGVLDAVEIRNRSRGRLNTSPGGAWLYSSSDTPGEPNSFSLRGEIVINEIMYHHPPTYRTTEVPFAENDEEWIELYNRSNAAVDLFGWRIEGEVLYSFPAGTIVPPDSYLIVARNAAALRLKYPGITIVGDFQGKLSNRSGRIVLKDPVGNPANEVTYHNAHPWPLYANGGGSTLELRDPRADNSVPEAWGASIEGTKARWKRYSYRAKAVQPVYSPGIFNFHEFRMGLLDNGEALVDNVTVYDFPTNGAPRQLLQNTNFTAGPAFWRRLGTHRYSAVEPHPDEPGNSVLHLIVTGPKSYMDNRLETTLKVGTALAPVVTGREYEITFDAKWLAGSPQLRTELYYNKVAAVTMLDTPANPGTPGRRNSIYSTNAGPTYTALRHFPVVPRAGESVEVAIQAADPDGMTGLNLWYSWYGNAAGSVAGPWRSVEMTRSGSGAATYLATIPPQTAGTIHFYVEGSDSLGATSTYPRAGRASRALIKVETARTNALRQIVRTIMLPPDYSLMHHVTNMMSDDLLGCTVVHQEQEVFYDAQIRPHGSMFSRNDPSTVGLTIKFPADHLFRGSRQSIVVRRRGMIETITKHILNAAGGIPGNYDDVVYLVSHRTDNVGNARMNLANYDDTYVDSQFENNSDGTVFKLEGIREYTTTQNGNPEGVKLSQPIGWIQTYDIANLGDDPEQYRWGIMIQSQRKRDDYSRIVAMGKSFSLAGTALQEAVTKTIDVDQWARLFALQTLLGIADIYGVENPHNFAFYVRPDDGRVVGLQNDWEFAFRQGTGDSIYGSKNVFKILRLPVFRRVYQGHLLDLINSVANATYLTNWARHYTTLTGEDNNLARTYVATRGNSVRSQLAARIPFEITSNSGADFTVETPSVTLQGRGWIDVYRVRRAGESNPLPVVWLDDQRWQLTLPLSRGTNDIKLVAYNYRGASVGDDSIAIATSVSEFPQRDYLRITEVMYNPPAPNAAEISAGFSDADDFEFIELLNNGPATLSLAGVKFTTGVTFDFASGSITNLPPAGRILLVENKAAFALRYGTNLPVAGEFTGNLSNGGEILTLVDAGGAIIHEFAYSDTGGWPVAADGSGRSLEVVDPSGAYGSATNWRASELQGGSPGSGVLTTRPAFDSVAISAGEVQLRFRASSGQAYTVHVAENLSGASWTIFKQIPAGVETRIEQVTDNPAGAKRFYRLSTP